MSTQDIDEALFGDGKLADQLAETFRLIAETAWEEGWYEYYYEWDRQVIDPQHPIRKVNPYSRGVHS